MTQKENTIRAEFSGLQTLKFGDFQMKYNLAEKKIWVTPTVEVAPVVITKSGDFDNTVEEFAFNDSLADKDEPGAAS
ncbi:MAG: hypothetical protein AAGA83_15995 [Cyanobacteria bacterium P01_F01_bin.116]